MLIQKRLNRAQSSVATQIRSEHIGLNSYLHRRRVSGVESPRCQCGYPSQNPKHMIMCCPRWARGRSEVMRKAKNQSFTVMMQSPEDISRITEWIIKEGWLEQFRLARDVEKLLKEREDASKVKRLKDRVDIAHG